MPNSIELTRFLDGLVRSDLQELHDTYFLWLLICTGIVAAGVILEEFESIPRYKLASWSKLITKLGWIMIIAGVIGEGVCEALVSKADGLLQTFNTIQLVATQEETSVADERASVADELAGRANERAAQANERARILEKEAAGAKRKTEELRAQNLATGIELEKEKTARLKIAENLEPRMITDEQAKTFKLRLAVLKGQRVAVIPANPTVESTLFAERLAIVLRNAGLDAIQPEIDSIPGSSLTGISFTCGKNRKSALDVLRAAFREVNLGKNDPTFPVETSANDETLEIRVFPKD